MNNTVSSITSWMKQMKHSKNKDLKWSEYDFTATPYNDLVRVGQRTMLYRDMFSVSWLLGRFCNYRCSYCWPYARSDRKDHRPTELCLKTVDEIKRQARERGFLISPILYSLPHSLLTVGTETI